MNYIASLSCTTSTGNLYALAHGIVNSVSLFLGKAIGVSYGSFIGGTIKTTSIRERNLRTRATNGKHHIPNLETIIVGSSGVVVGTISCFHSICIRL